MDFRAGDGSADVVGNGLAFRGNRARVMPAPGFLVLDGEASGEKFTGIGVDDPSLQSGGRNGRDRALECETKDSDKDPMLQSEATTTSLFSSSFTS